MTWTTTSPFWNTQFQQLRPATRTEVSPQQTTRARRSRSKMLATSASKHDLPRRSAASSAPSLIASPNSSSSSRLRRQQLVACMKRKYMVSATMPTLNGVLGSKSSGTGASVTPPQHWQCPA